MSLVGMIATFVAGIAAGTINTVVGSGTLVTFPTLLAFGVPPVTANVSNTVGLVFGSTSGAIGYRRELAGQRSRMLRLGTASLLGGVTGGILLLTLPSTVFAAVVPVLILLGCALVVAGPWLSRQMAKRRAGEHERPAHGGPLLVLGVYAAGIYGGYFGAAQGVILVGILGLLLDETLQRVNAAKNVLALIVNGVAALLFVFVAHVDWIAAGLIAAGSIIGGVVGASVGRRLPPLALRIVIVVIGVVATVKLLLA